VSYTRPDHDAADATFAGLPGYSRPGHDAAYAAFAEVTYEDIEARVAAASPLGAAAVLAYVAPLGWVQVAGPLSDAIRIRGEQPPFGMLAVPGPLGTPAPLLLHDFSAAFAVGRVVPRIRGYLVGAFGVLCVPISSCQGTLRLGDDGYLQMVVPNARAYQDALLATESFYVTMAGVFGGLPTESILAAADLTGGGVSLAFGGFSQSATISGRPAAYVGPTEGNGLRRELTGVRAVFATLASRRVRCDVDWLLRPGYTAVADGAEFNVDYLNFYWQAEGDVFMDVGDSGG
jgi:hypothetical protein